MRHVDNLYSVLEVIYTWDDPLLHIPWNPDELACLGADRSYRVEVSGLVDTSNIAHTLTGLLTSVGVVVVYNQGGGGSEYNIHPPSQLC